MVGNRDSDDDQENNDWNYDNHNDHADGNAHNER
jgi:hypothetical protein